MKKFVAAIALLLNIGWAAAQSPTFIRHQFNWEKEPEALTLGNEQAERWVFKGSVSSSEHPGLSFFIKRFPVERYGTLEVDVLEARYEPIELSLLAQDASYLSEALQFETHVERERQSYYGKVAFCPIVRRGGRYERLQEVSLRIRLRPQPEVSFRDPDDTNESVLKDGDIYKIAVNRNGVYKLTYSFLKDELGMNIDNIDPRQIKLYGNGGGVLPFFAGAERTDDLRENAIRISGEEDGRFDPGDYILFYGEGPDKWLFNESEQAFILQKNIYDTHNYYFLKASPGNGARVVQASAPGTAAATSTSFDDYARLEKDEVNLMYEWEKSQGSGQSWYGDHFKVARQYSYNNAFSFPNLQTSEPALLRASMALRSRIGSRFYVDLAGETIQSNSASSVSSIGSSEDNTRPYASRATLSDTVLLNNASISFTVRYPYPQGAGDESEGWLDYVQFNVRRALRMEGTQMAFRDKRSLAAPATTFRLDGAAQGLLAWDITDPLSPEQVPAELSGQQLSFRANTEVLREFVAFYPNGELLKAEAIGKIPNQNLHAIDNVGFVIITHEDFMQEAQRLAQHRANHDGLTVEVVEIGQVYNEFASGRTDPTAIRDFARMLYQRTEQFRYLLLFGDGTFDARGLYGLGGNFIPTYQKESYNPVEAYPTDDYYALLDSPNASDPLDGSLSISVGRLPVKTADEAAVAVDKIIHYDSSEDVLGDWRNRLVFVGDDNDRSPGFSDIDHYEDADDIAEALNDTIRQLNLEKIYLDAFPQESTPGGERIPQATEQLNKAIYKGALAVTYLGHGGPKGWAQERVLNITDILSWNNYGQMPIFITATCSFTGYDDPTFTTAGEEAFLNPKGGAIALMTTVRAVYASSNVRMTENALDYMFVRNSSGNVPTIGEAFQRGKNDVSGNFNINNSRKFALIGDPSMKIALPKYKVTTTHIDSEAVSPQQPDTLRALQKVTIEGEVQGLDGNLLSGFNGIIYPTIFDKAQQVATLGQGSNKVYNYRIQKNVLFRGRASVTNGRFRFTFVVPRDINYQYGFGKISYYASDGATLEDAAGSYENIIIGGTDPNALADDTGPKVEVYMNTEDFVFGGITNANPTLLAVLEDDNGINVVGNSIGHDLEGVLNGNTQNTYLLNDFYESELDDYTRGKVRYPLSSLPEGRHTIRVKAWDVANNSAEGYTEFVVAASEEVALEHVLNYPNPFTGHTCFQFDHNLANQELEVMVQVFTISGRLVKTIQANIFSDGALRRDDCIEWDGRDDYGGQLGRGVYLYKVKVRAANVGNTVLSGESEFEKLVILK
ncbi:MAG: type IX secretion system sortase PorU [Phaeodactylibacter sp.]|nr:type IX secretion system sortase PorU [Phaeodactylibacter sp.]MCB9273906.1 type IX secretion system sortase PorU [Lewinellaceae bacterium]